MANELLKIEEGETEEEAIAKWWVANGLDPLVAREKRQVEYLRQLKETAVMMDKFKNSCP
jgi:hypothetical protein